MFFQIYTPGVVHDEQLNMQHVKIPLILLQRLKSFCTQLVDLFIVVKTKKMKGS